MLLGISMLAYEFITFLDSQQFLCCEIKMTFYIAIHQSQRVITCSLHHFGCHMFWVNVNPLSCSDSPVSPPENNCHLSPKLW